MRCVVTGALGFVGLNLTRRLVADGHDVVAVARLEPDEWAMRFLSGKAAEVRFVTADLATPGALGAALDGLQFDVLAHAAAVTATTMEVERDDARVVAQVNVIGTIEALEAARRGGARRFLYVSSPAAIGPATPNERGMIDEGVATNPTTTYGLTKAAGEWLTRRCGELHGMSTVSARIAQPYGQGERPTPSRVRTSPIYEWLLAASSGETLITGPLDAGRDWTHIDDTCDGLTTLASAPTLASDLYHVSAGTVTKVREVVDALLGEFPELHIDDRPEPEGINPNISGGTTRTPLDTGRMAAEHGWRAKIGFREGMSSYIHWWRGWNT